MAVAAVPPRRKLNTTSNTFGVERSDSLTLVTSCIASAMHQTGQWPPTGHNAVDRAEIGTGSCSRCSVAGTFVEHASGEDHGSSTGLLSTTQARSTPGERSKGAATGLTHLAPISDLLICGILMWGQVRRFGLTGDRVDESQIGARIGELGRVKMFQQMRDCAVGPRVRHRMDVHAQDPLFHIGHQVGL